MSSCLCNLWSLDPVIRFLTPFGPSIVLYLLTTVLHFQLLLYGKYGTVFALILPCMQKTIKDESYNILFYALIMKLFVAAYICWACLQMTIEHYKTCTTSTLHLWDTIYALQELHM